MNKLKNWCNGVWLAILGKPVTTHYSDRKDWSVTYGDTGEDIVN